MMIMMMIVIFVNDINTYFLQKEAFNELNTSRHYGNWVCRVLNKPHFGHMLILV